MVRSPRELEIGGSAGVAEETFDSGVLVAVPAATTVESLGSLPYFQETAVYVVWILCFSYSPVVVSVVVPFLSSGTLAVVVR